MTQLDGGCHEGTVRNLTLAEQFEQLLQESRALGIRIAALRAEIDGHVAEDAAKKAKDAERAAGSLIPVYMPR